MKGQKKEVEKAIQFINFTNEDFTWKFDGVAYTIKAKQSTYLKEYQARMFAGHLVDRELNRENKPTNIEPRRGELLVKALGEKEIKAEGVDAIENKVDSKNREDNKEEFPDLKKKSKNKKK